MLTVPPPRGFASGVLLPAALAATAAAPIPFLALAPLLLPDEALGFFFDSSPDPAVAPTFALTAVNSVVLTTPDGTADPTSVAVAPDVVPVVSIVEGVSMNGSGCSFTRSGGIFDMLLEDIAKLSCTRVLPKPKHIPQSNTSVPRPMCTRWSRCGDTKRIGNAGAGVNTDQFNTLDRFARNRIIFSITSSPIAARRSVIALPPATRAFSVLMRVAFSSRSFSKPCSVVTVACGNGWSVIPNSKLKPGFRAPGRSGHYGTADWFV
eukprot:SAG31_NODE_6850_length_1870_cov_1.686053_2_plen_264_part_00